MSVFCTCNARTHMSRLLTPKLNKRGKIRKTVDIAPAIYKRATVIMKRDKRPRTFTRLVEDLFEAEYDRLLGKAA